MEFTQLGSTADPSGDGSECRLVIALGGDGTILRELQLDAIARGAAQVDERTALVTTIQTEEPHHRVAFNDVVVTRTPGYGTARLRIKVGGETLLALRGDGVVIASPTTTHVALALAASASVATADSPSQELLAYATTKGAIQNFTAGLAQLLAEKGINAEIINIHTIKPLDAQMILESARKTRIGAGWGRR